MAVIFAKMGFASFFILALLGVSQILGESTEENLEETTPMTQESRDTTEAFYDFEIGDRSFGSFSEPKTPKEIKGTSQEIPKEIKGTTQKKDGGLVNGSVDWKSVFNEPENSVETEVERELSTWEAPYEIQKNFPYYLSGVDDEDRPIWIAEVGRWNFRLITDAGEDARILIEKYAAQGAHRIVKDLKPRNTPEYPDNSGVVILDLDGFSLIQVAHLPTVALIIRVLRIFLDLIDTHLYVAILVNVSAPAQALISAVRPLLGRVFERVQIYGTNKARWIPEILKYCPKNQIAPWYGGSKDFTPIKVYG